MSNPLSIQKMMFQPIDDNGIPNGPPTYGITAADMHQTTYINTFENIAELNETINKAKSILAVVDPVEEKFGIVNHKTIGKNNYYGKNYRE